MIYYYSISERKHFFPFWLRHQRRCDRHHTGDHFGRSSLLIYTGTQARVWTHLDTFNSIDEVTPHQFGTVYGEGFSYSDLKTQFPSTSISRWSPTKIPQPWLNKSRLLRPPLKSLPSKIKKWSYGSNKRKIGPKAIRKMKETAIEEVITEDLFLQMTRTQIFFKRWEGRWTNWRVSSRRKQTEVWID